MGVEGRATICNMAIEMGAKNGIMEPNKEVIQYVSQRTGKKKVNWILLNPMKMHSIQKKCTLT